MKTPTKCEIVPIKPMKSWRPIKRRSSKSCLPPKLSFTPHDSPSHQCPAPRPPPLPAASVEEIPD